jgi:hypothetical protein
MKLIIILCMFFNIMAPMPPGIAINPETKECGDYFGGDEYGSYNLPDPWQIIYHPTIETDGGTVEWNGTTEEYCKQIGYTYVPGNIGTIYGREVKSPIFFTLIIMVVAPILILLAVIGLIYSLVTKWMRKHKN